MKKIFLMLIMTCFALPAHAEDKPYKLSPQDKTVSVPVLARDIDRGAIIQPDDIAWQDMPERKVHRGTLMEGENIVGMVAKRGLRSGEQVSERVVMRPRIIERGGLVSMIYRTQHMELKDMGVALEDGSAGDMIRVKNDRSGKIMLMKVLENGEVEVSL